MANEKKGRLSELFELFGVFFKIGLFTFGGGYAMIPLIQRETAEKRDWVTEHEILDIIAVAESTPGPIAVNSATFIGYRRAGVIGAAFATFGLVLPSFLIIFLLSSVLRRFESNRFVRYAFFGIRAGVLALIVKALIGMIKQCPRDVFSGVIAAAAFVLAAFTPINVLWIILGSAVCGLVYYLVTANRRKNGDGGDKDEKEGRA